ALAVSDLDNFNIYVAHDKNEPIEGIWTDVLKICQRFNFPQKRCRSVPIDFTLSAHLEAPSVGSFLTYARLYLASVLKEECMLYLDSDVLVMRDLSELLLMMPKDTVCAAVQDKSSPQHSNDGYLIDGKEASSESDYFNAGMLLLNTRMCQEIDLLEQVKKIQPRITNLRFFDQTYLNIILNGQWHKLSPIWNMQTTPRDPVPMKSDEGQTGIIHYIAEKKPWLTATLDLPNLLWHSIAKSIEIPITPEVEDELHHLISRFNQNKSNVLLRIQYYVYRLKFSSSKRSRAVYSQMEILKNQPWLNMWLTKKQLTSIL
ncbi:hypothetical protein N9P58_02230, partial [Puniceicoccaceae bacterium]|nr:hypothetical protein [Puniceicoccaceae bacterium]